MISHNFNLRFYKLLGLIATATFHLSRTELGEPQHRTAPGHRSARIKRLTLVMILLGSSATSAVSLKVALLPSWGTGWQDPSLVYVNLALSWSSYGPHELLFFDLTQPITNEALTLIDPDVLVLGDPSGGNEVYTVAEKEAIIDYLTNHDCGAVGTFKFFHSFFEYDNSFLMEIFGIDGTFLTEFHNCTTGLFTILDNGLPIFNEVGSDSFQSNGWTCSQDIGGAAWQDVLLPDTHVAALTTDALGVIVIHEAFWRSIYCSTMPEYALDRPGDPQLLYNAIVWAAGHDPRRVTPISHGAAMTLILTISAFLMKKNNLRRRRRNRIRNHLLL